MADAADRKWYLTTTATTHDRHHVHSASGDMLLRVIQFYLLNL